MQSLCLNRPRQTCSSQASSSGSASTIRCSTLQCRAKASLTPLAKTKRLRLRPTLRGLSQRRHAQAHPDSSKIISLVTEEEKRQQTKESEASLSMSAEEPETSSQDSSKLLVGGAVLGGLLLVGGLSVVYQDQIKDGLNYFTTVVDDMGPAGYGVYMVLYTALEVLAVPAIPLTLTAGLLFGAVPGTIMVSVCATAAATIAFLISRYFAREKVLDWAKDNKRFAAIDRAIGADGLKVVMFLRLSPLLPLAASNYLYGLTSVSLNDYVLGSWLGMLPGTIAYVSAGDVGKTLLQGGEGAGFSWWQGAVALGATVVAVWYVGDLASRALTDIEATIDEADGSAN